MKGFLDLKFYKKLKQKKGQSILEFALMLPFIFFFIFIHIQLCISYIIAEYTNYVSYMSARSVLTNGHLEGRHLGVINRYIDDDLKRIIRMETPRLIKFNPRDRQFVFADTRIKEGTQWNKPGDNDSENRNLGVEIDYQIPVFMPFLRELGNSLKFKNRTVLGREPYHGGAPIPDNPWLTQDPQYGDSFGKSSACSSVYNDNGC